MRKPYMLVAGGGVALLYASRNLDAVKEKLSNFDQQIGVQIVQSALKMPLKTIADNAGACMLHAVHVLLCSAVLLHLHMSVIAAAASVCMTINGACVG